MKGTTNTDLMRELGAVRADIAELRNAVEDIRETVPERIMEQLAGAVVAIHEQWSGEHDEPNPRDEPEPDDPVAWFEKMIEGRA